MNHDVQSALEDVTRAFAARDFVEAGRMAEAMIATAGRGRPLEEVGDALLATPRLLPIFPNTAELLAAGPFFERVYAALQAALGPEDVRVARFRARFASIASSRGDYPTASALLAQSLATLERTLGPADPKTRMLRSNLAIQHRNANHPERADALFAGVSLCEHLRPLVADLLSRGVHVLDVTSPWTDNCRDWMYLADVVLDAEALAARLHLPASVQVHRHRGTVDGAEQGLVCTIDHDAVMGLHPDVASAGTRVLS